MRVHVAFLIVLPVIGAGIKDFVDNVMGIWRDRLESCMWTCYGKSLFGKILCAWKYENKGVQR